MSDDNRFLEVLRERLADEDLMDSTRKRIVLDTKHFCEWYRGTYGDDPNPDDLSLNSADLNDYKSSLLRRCQANTTERKLASLRTALKLVAVEVLTKLRFPKVAQSPKPAPSGFSRKERLAIFRAADRLTTRDRAIIYLAMWTGARSSSISDAKLSGVSIKSRSGSEPVTYMGYTEPSVVGNSVEGWQGAGVSDWRPACANLVPLRRRKPTGTYPSSFPSRGGPAATESQKHRSHFGHSAN